MPNTSYIFKFKTTDTAQETLEQIDSNGYTLPYHSDGMPVVIIGVKFNVENRIPENWVIRK